MCSEATLKKILSEVRRESERIFGDNLVDVILYGSYARGDFDEESDIDIMVRVDIDRSQFSSYNNQLSYVTSDLGLEYDVVVSVHLQNYSFFEKYLNIVPFYQNVINEGIIVNERI